MQLCVYLRSTALDINKHPVRTTIGKLCAMLECQPGDILEYVPDEAENLKWVDEHASI